MVDTGANVTVVPVAQMSPSKYNESGYKLFAANNNIDQNVTLS